MNTENTTNKMQDKLQNAFYEIQVLEADVGHKWQLALDLYFNDVCIYPFWKPLCSLGLPITTLGEVAPSLVTPHNEDTLEADVDEDKIWEKSRIRTQYGRMTFFFSRVIRAYAFKYAPKILAPSLLKKLGGYWRHTPHYRNDPDLPKFYALDLNYFRFIKLIVDDFIYHYEHGSRRTLILLAKQLARQLPDEIPALGITKFKLFSGKQMLAGFHPAPNYIGPDPKYRGKWIAVVDCSSRTHNKY